MNNKKTYCLLGKDIEYSLSPKIYNYWFNKYNINAEYNIVNLFNSKDLHDFLEKKSSKFNGLNFTQPFKEEAFLYEEKYNFKNINEDSLKTKVINNILINEEGRFSYNTDIFGILKSIENFNLDNDSKVLVLGSGATAKSVIYSLNKLNYKTYVFCRSKEKFDNLKSIYTNINYYENNINYNLVVNATSVSFSDIVSNINITSKIYWDLNYRFDNSNLNNCYDGLNMLVYQAAYNFYLWFNIMPDVKKDIKEIICT